MSATENNDPTAFATRLVHAGGDTGHVGGAVVQPIFQTSTYLYAGGDGPHGIRYTRYNNTPNQTALGRRLAAIHGAEAGLPTASGMAAISTVLLGCHQAGDHLLVLDSLYGGTHQLVHHDLPRWGIAATAFSADEIGADGAGLEGHLRPTTRSIYVETVTNPTLRVPDHRAIVRFARRHGLLAIVDNTFATAVAYRPIERGYDLAIESSSKYNGGHSDVIAGVILGGAERVEALRHLLNNHGGTLDPHAAFLVQRGLVTLELRVRRQSATAAELADWLAAEPAVERVWFPGLASHPDHEVASAQLEGFGAMVAFELAGGVGEAERFLDALELIAVAPSLGGPETLITRPAATAHSGLSSEERARSGVSDRLLRLTVGLEAPGDLIADLGRALAALAVAKSVAKKERVAGGM